MMAVGRGNAGVHWLAGKGFVVLPADKGQAPDQRHLPVQRPSLEMSPRKMFISTVSAISSALCPVTTLLTCMKHRDDAGGKGGFEAAVPWSKTNARAYAPQ